MPTPHLGGDNSPLKGTDALDPAGRSSDICASR
jgi:hypothetical protein